MNVNEKLNERRSIIAQQREMNDRAVAEKRDFNAEEKARYDKMEADANSIKAVVDRHLALEQAEKDNAHQAEPVRAKLDSDAQSEDLRSVPGYKAAFLAWAKNGNGNIAPEIKATLTKASPAGGGYLLPIEFDKQIRLKQYNANIIRQLATVQTTTSQVDIPMEGNLPVPGWIDELGTYPATDLTVGQVVFSAYKLGMISTISEELLEDAFTDLPAYLAGRGGLSAGFTEEASFISGDGNKKPTGILTTVTATTTTAANSNITSTDMNAAFYALPRAYRRNATWLVADSVISRLRQEKSTTGQYLWAPALTANAPDVYLGKPIFTSDFLAPFAASSVSAIFGDFSYYQIMDRTGWSAQRLNELYAANGQVGFKMWERVDAKVLRPEAFVTVTTHV